MGEIVKIHIGSGTISSTSMKKHQHIVSGIHLDLNNIENVMLYTTSMDATIMVMKWLRECESVSEFVYSKEKDLKNLKKYFLNHIVIW